MNPSVTIVLVTHHSLPHLSGCLKALTSLHYDPEPQIVVVDNASHDESIACVQQMLPNAIILPQSHNMGFAGGVNIGVASSQSDIVVLLNPDTIVQPLWLETLVKALDHPRCGIAGSKILQMDGETLLHTGGAFLPSTFLTTHRGYGERDRGQYDTREAVPFLTGASMALRREVWNKLNGFDAGFYPAYFEDLDLCLRVTSLNLECHYVPQSVLCHAESVSTGKYSGTFYYYNHRNRFRLACKHMSWAQLWREFCPAEICRLNDACLLDRLVAGLVYRQSLPQGLTPPDLAEQEHMLATGQILASVREEDRNAPQKWSVQVQELLGTQATLRAEMASLLTEMQQNAVLREHEFRSQVLPIAWLRRLWNSISTRWYVLPVLHQQTRANLAMSRSIDQLVAHIEMDSALLANLVYQAALCFRLGQSDSLCNVV